MTSERGFEMRKKGLEGVEGQLFGNDKKMSDITLNATRSCDAKDNSYILSHCNNIARSSESIP